MVPRAIGCNTVKCTHLVIDFTRPVGGGGGGGGNVLSHRCWTCSSCFLQRSPKPPVVLPRARRINENKTLSPTRDTKQSRSDSALSTPANSKPK